jgi:hypothetical protein
MKGCHSCKFKSAVDAGAFKNTIWENTPCSKCDVMTGMGFSMDYDENRISPELRATTPPIFPQEERDHLGEEDKMGESIPMAALREIVVGLLSLPSDLRDVVAWRFTGMTYRDIAADHGVTIACAEKRHRRALELFPALQSMFPEKVAKQKRRKKHEKRAK